MVGELARVASLLREHLPTSSDRAVPELSELSDMIHEHLTALSRAAAGARAVAPGALRGAFEDIAARAEPSPENRPGGEVADTARVRALELCTATVDALEELTGIIAARRRRSFTHGLHEAPSGAVEARHRAHPQD